MKPELIKNEKPMTQATKDKLNLVAKELVNWKTKKDIAIKFNCSERKARDMIAAVAKKIPIISVSDREGYKWARTPEDLEFVKQAYAETDSRIRELFARKAPLAEFLKQFKEEKFKDGDC